MGITEHILNNIEEKEKLKYIGVATGILYLCFYCEYTVCVCVLERVFVVVCVVF